MNQKPNESVHKVQQHIVHHTTLTPKLYWQDASISTDVITIVIFNNKKNISRKLALPARVGITVLRARFKKSKGGPFPLPPPALPSHNSYRLGAFLTTQDTCRNYSNNLRSIHEHRVGVYVLTEYVKRLSSELSYTRRRRDIDSIKIC